MSTRQWARDCGYDAARLFTKFFGDDVRYLLSMEKLWAERRPPEPMEWAALTDKDEQSHSEELADQVGKEEAVSREDLLYIQFTTSFSVNLGRLES